MTITCEHRRERDTCPECAAARGLILEQPKTIDAEFVTQAIYDEFEAHGGISADALAATHGGGGGEWTPEEKIAAMPRSERREERRRLGLATDKIDANLLEDLKRGMPEGKRRLTDVEEKWYRMKHPEMKKRDQDRLIAEGLPADAPPITRADLPSGQYTEPKGLNRKQWKKIKKARKTAARTRARARR